MARIYRARDAQLERDVAVKLLRTEFGRDPDFLARFRDEARAAASLSHPNIVAVHDFGEDDSGPYIVMELVEGQDLASIIRESGPLAPRQAARVSAEVGKALHAAHVRGIVHRDVKPSNVLVGRDGRVKVADFGIARALAESQLTLPGTTMGSVHYFSPEQARGEPATVASDIYALGIVLYESLTGQRPFSGDGSAAVALARLTTTPPRPSALRPSVPPALDAIVLRAMALHPEHRYSSAAAMASALEGFLGTPAAQPPAGQPPAAAPVGAAMTVASAAARPNPPVPYPPEAYARGNGPSPISTRGTPPPPPARDDDDGGGAGVWAWVAGALGLVILAVAGFLIFQLLAGGGTPAPSASPSLVTVPSFVNLAYTDAEATAADVGLTVVRAASEERTDVAPDTVLSQDPAQGASVPADTEIKLTVARGKESVAVPDLRNRPESEALQLVVTDSLSVGSRTEAFDPFVPVGAVISQTPGPGILVTPRHRSTTWSRRVPSRRPARPRRRRPRRRRRPARPRRPRRPDAAAHADPGAADADAPPTAPPTTAVPPTAAPVASGSAARHDPRRAPPQLSSSPHSDQPPGAGTGLAGGGSGTRCAVPPPAARPAGDQARRLERTFEVRDRPDRVAPRSAPSPPGSWWRALDDRLGCRPARAHLGPPESDAARVEPAQAEAIRDASAEVTTRRARGGRAPADPASGGLGLRGSAMRTTPERHGRIVAAPGAAVER